MKDFIEVVCKIIFVLFLMVLPMLVLVVYGKIAWFLWRIL